MSVKYGGRKPNKDMFLSQDDLEKYFNCDPDTAVNIIRLFDRSAGKKSEDENVISLAELATTLGSKFRSNLL